MSNKEFKFKIGQVVKNEYSGAEGRIVIRCQYLTGCNRYSLQPKGLDEDGRPFENIAFDEDELILVEESGRKEARKDGGPVPEPPSKHQVGA